MAPPSLQHEATAAHLMTVRATKGPSPRRGALLVLCWSAACLVLVRPDAVARPVTWRVGVGAPEVGFLWNAGRNARVASDSSLSEAAWAYLEAHVQQAHLPRRTLASVRLSRMHDVGRGGVVAVFERRVGPVPVIRERVSVLMTRDGALVAVSGGFSALEPPRTVSRTGGQARFDRSLLVHGLPSLFGASSRDSSSSPLEAWFGASSVKRALSAAFRRVVGGSVPASAWRDLRRPRAGYADFDLDPARVESHLAAALARPARVGPVYVPGLEVLVPALYVEIDQLEPGGTAARLHAVLVDAESGNVLDQWSLTDDSAYAYRVWGATTGGFKPADGPTEDYAPHPTGADDGSIPAFVDPVVVEVKGLNNGPGGGSDPWLPDDAVETVGNNVDAYVDHFAPDGLSDGDFRASLSAPHAFDRVYDTALEPYDSDDQAMAAVAQLFFTTNWLHDWYYDSGFDEAAGNAQADNYGRGGIEGDPLRAEAQDSLFDPNYRNNANMSTPADGASPRMQMFVWSARVDASVLVDPGAVSLETGTANFGPDTFQLSRRVVLVDDGDDVPLDGCAPGPDWVSRVDDLIVLVERGGCSFQDKAINAQDAGAAGLLIMNDMPGDPPPQMGDVDPSLVVNIPILSITYEDGAWLEARLEAASAWAEMYRETGPERDGSIDNSVVAHEFGHYLMRRLAPWCSTKQCDALGEGWSDFVALHLTYEQGDDRYGTYANAYYAKGADDSAPYFGTRRVPYSIDFTRNDLTFRHIQDGEPLPDDISIRDNGVSNSESHNAGEIWATMMWEAYMAFMGITETPDSTFTFEDARRLMSDMVVTAFTLAPPDATFTEMRDAVLASALAIEPTVFQTFAEAFARRGAGSCAESPPRYSQDLVGVVESHVLAPNIQIIDLTIDDSTGSCDQDGVPDAGEAGFLTVRLVNDGAEAAEDAVLMFNPSSNALELPAEPQRLPQIGPLQAADFVVPVTVDPTLTDITWVTITLVVSSLDACNQGTDATFDLTLNLDELPGASTVETVEGTDPPWDQADKLGGFTVWSQEIEAQNHYYHAVDPPSLSDAWLQSPPLLVSEDQAFVVTFRHRFAFEASWYDSSYVYWDGGVVEISNDGKSWTDVAELVSPGYTGVLSNLAGNPLSDRPAYADQSEGWPDWQTVTLDFGDAFAGQTVQIRFRVGADEAVGAYGWDIDDISFSGILNSPFSAVVPDSPAFISYYQDTDGDGFGVDSVTSERCYPPPGFALASGDCDDTDADTYPGAVEICDGKDNDCDCEGVSPPCTPLVDENAVDATLYFQDLDGDGFGSGSGTSACAPPDGTSDNDLDCDDTRSDIYPGADEQPGDGIDHDCDGIAPSPSPSPTATPAPVGESPTPEAETATPAPVGESPTPVAETATPAPVGESPTPEAETATPASTGESPTPEAETATPAPVGESPTPEAETATPAPVGESPTPEAETATPAPVGESPTPEVETATPASTGESPTPEVETATPASTGESPTPVDETPSPLPASETPEGDISGCACVQGAGDSRGGAGVVGWLLISWSLGPGRRRGRWRRRGEWASR